MTASLKRFTAVGFSCALSALVIASTASATPVGTGLALWLDASDLTATLGDGASVAQWNDKSSGTAYNAFQLTPTAQPTLATTALNGHPAVRFDGLDDVLVIDDALALGRPYTIFIVDQYYGAIQGRTLDSRDINWLAGKWGGGNAHYAEGWVTVPGGVAAGIDAPVIGEAVGGVDNSHYFIDGTNRTNVATPVGVPGKLRLGGQGTEFSQADVAELLIYDRVLTKVERHDVGLYLADKYGLATDYLDSSTFVNHGSVTPFSGGDPGEGLDLDGNFEHAVNLGGTSIFVGDTLFVADSVAPGFSFVSNNVLNPFYTRPVYGDTAADNALESAMHSIRWSGGGNPINNVTLTLDVTPGDDYQLQVLFSENIAGATRMMDVSVNGRQQTDASQFVASDGTGRVFTYSFTATTSPATVVIEGTHVGRDPNPAVNAVTLENLSQPAPTHVGTTTLGTFTGGDLGEGLDLEVEPGGEFVYAVNVGGPVATVRGVEFAANDVVPPPPGVGIGAVNHLNPWYVFEYGTSADDNALETIMAPIRWSPIPELLAVTLDDLTVGEPYKLQLLFDEQEAATLLRGWDVIINGVLAADDMTSTLGGTATPGVGVVLTHEFVAEDTSLTIILDGADTDAAYADKNPILQGVTLEHVPVPEPTTLGLLLAGLGLLLARRRFVR